MKPDLVRIGELTVGYPTRDTPAVRDVSLRLAEGEFHGLVGESGSGKSTVARTLLGLSDGGAQVRSGSVAVTGIDVLELRGRALRQLRGSTVGYIGQNPFGALHPLLRIGRQFELIRRAHRDVMSREEGRARASDLLRQVGMHDPAAVLSSYAHQLSGGMAQRVVIAMSMLLEPKLIVADEPTTGLDVTIQKQTLDLLSARARTDGVGLLLITHDLGVVAQYCEMVTVLYGGQVMEAGPVDRVFTEPRHAYTQALLRAVPVPHRAPPVSGAPGYPAIDAGCPFRERCPVASTVCATPPPSVEVEPAWVVNCHAMPVEI